MPHKKTADDMPHSPTYTPSRGVASSSGHGNVVVDPPQMHDTHEKGQQPALSLHTGGDADRDLIGIGIGIGIGVDIGIEPGGAPVHSPDSGFHEAPSPSDSIHLSPNDVSFEEEGVGIVPQATTRTKAGLLKKEDSLNQLASHFVLSPPPSSPGTLTSVDTETASHESSTDGRHPGHRQDSDDLHGLRGLHGLDDSHDTSAFNGSNSPASDTSRKRPARKRQKQKKDMAMGGGGGGPSTETQEAPASPPASSSSPAPSVDHPLADHPLPARSRALSGLAAPATAAQQNRSKRKHESK